MRARLHAFLVAWMLALRIAGLCLRAELDYRANFVTSIVFGVAWQASVVVFAAVLLGSFPGMQGWPSRSVLLIASMRMLSHGLFALLFDRNDILSVIIQDGRLEAFLLRPMPVYRQIQVAIFPTNAFGDLSVGVSMFAWAVWVIDLHWTLERIAYLTAGLIGGTLMEAAVSTTLASFLLHFPATSAWHIWIEELMGTFGSYPLGFLPRLMSNAFTFILPLAFIAYFPAAVLTSHTSGLNVPVAVATAGPSVSLAAFIGSRLLWNARLRRYTGVTG